MQKIFTQLEETLRRIAKERRATQEAITGFEKVGKDYNQEYFEAYIKPKMKSLQSNLKVLEQEAYEKVGELLQSFEKAAVEKQKAWTNLDNPKLANALKIIDLGGGKLAGNQVREINAQFFGDASSLRALKAIYDAQGIYDGGIDELLYEPEWAVRSLSEWSYATFVQSGSVNQFADKIAKIAKLEGVDFPSLIDEKGVVDAARRGAGLPE